MRQLSEIRNRGYATTSEEMTIGASSIAAPIRDADQRVIAALGLVTSSRHRALHRLIPAVQLAAASITRTAGPFVLPEAGPDPSARGQARSPTGSSPTSG